MFDKIIDFRDMDEIITAGPDEFTIDFRQDYFSAFGIAFLVKERMPEAANAVL